MQMTEKGADKNLVAKKALVWHRTSHLMPEIDPELGKRDLVDAAGGDAFKKVVEQAMDIATHKKWSQTLQVAVGGVLLKKVPGFHACNHTAR